MRSLWKHSGLMAMLTVVATSHAMAKDASANANDAVIIVGPDNQPLPDRSLDPNNLFAETQFRDPNDATSVSSSDSVDDQSDEEASPQVPSRRCRVAVFGEVLRRLEVSPPGLGARGVFSAVWGMRLDERGRPTTLVNIQSAGSDELTAVMFAALKPRFRVFCPGTYQIAIAWSPDGWLVDMPNRPDSNERNAEDGER